MVSRVAMGEWQGKSWWSSDLKMSFTNDILMFAGDENMPRLRVERYYAEVDPDDISNSHQ
jgi:hypothetical protein